MNRTYRLIWSQLGNTWIAVAENAKGKGKSIGGRKLIAAALTLTGGLLLTSSAYAADAANASVTSGVGRVSQSGTTTTINQGSQNLAIDWTKLSTTANEALIFNQPNSSAIALNRITGSSPSTLLGSLSANGQVFILNPNGVLFGAGAQINVGGLVASTLSMSNADLQAGKMIFAKDGNASGSVVNQGTINAADGGYVALIGATVRNQGTINARLGTALLAAGNKVTLNLNNGSLLGYRIDQGALNALAENRQLIQANGGQVLMSAKALNNLTTAVVNNTGIIEAKTVQNKSGRIMLISDMEVGTVTVGGTLDASAPTSGDGGFIETSAAHVKIASDAIVTTKAADGVSGSWLIDPVDFTIAATGGDITGSALSAQLANNGTVTILNTQGVNGTAGDINVNDTVSWSSNGILALTADNNINVNAAITATGRNAGLKLNYGGAYNVKAPITLSGANSSLSINGQAYTLIRSMAQLDALDKNNAVTGAGTAALANGFYALAQDLNAAGTTYTKSLLGTSSSVTFGGTFAGLGHTISNLTINAAGGAGLFGLVGVTSVIRDFGLIGGNIYGANGDVGALAGRITGGSINNVYASGVTVGGATRTGGLVGYLNGGSIGNSYASGNVSSSGSYAGGLVGFSSGVVSNSYAEGDVSGIYVGGLVGYNNTGAVISQSYATGDVNGIIGGAGSSAGGLVGVNSGGMISYAYATGAVQGDSLAGGLIGSNSGTVSNVYATGKVTLAANPNLFNSYAGGLIAFDSGTAGNTVWDSASTGKSTYTDANGAATSTTDVNAGTRYNHGSYGALGTWTETVGGSGVWVARDAGGNPQWVMVEGSTRPFLYSEWSTSIGNAHQFQLMAANLSASYTLARNIDASATSGADASGMWSAAGFASVGNSTANFGGRLDGQNRTVDGLTIVRLSTDNVGLFGWTSADSDIRNIGLTSVAIKGHSGVGALAGNNSGAISDSYATGNVNGAGAIGGLIGQTAATSRISGSYAAVDVKADAGGGSAQVGGLVGYNAGDVDNSYATGKIDATGGLISTIQIGGLAGTNTGRVTNSYATGAVSNLGGNFFIGGLVGDNFGDIGNSYATGAVNVGGSFFTPYIGALVGNNEGSGSVVASFWKNSVSVGGIGGGIGGGTVDALTRGLSDTEFTSSATFSAAGWDIDAAGGTGKIWRIYEGNTGPLLRSFLTGVTLADNNTTYNGAVQNGASSATAGILGTMSSGRNAGVYNGYYSGQQGYDITGGTLIIAKADLVLGAVTDSKTYDGTTASSGAVGKAGLAGSDSVTGLTQSFDSKNVLGANDSTLAVDAGYVVADGNNGGNYNVILTTATGTINKATLTVTGVAADNKTYNASDAATLSSIGTLIGLVGGETLTLNNTGATFADKNAGTGKLVTATYSLADGTDGLAGNYQLATAPVTTTASIDRAALTISGITAGDKTYNASTAATVSTANAAYTGLFADDVVTVSATGLFNDKNVGTGKTVNLTSSYSGADAGNYVITDQTGTTANISQASLTVSGITAVGKSYNASNAATVSTAGAVYDGLFAGDAVSVAATGSFSDKNAGANKTVNLSSSYSGADVGNYAITDQIGTTATISQASLTLSTSDVVKTYDAGTGASGTTIITGGALFNGDNLTGGSFAFTNKNAGTGDKVVNVSGVTVGDGVNNGNYNVSYVSNTTSTIKKADLSVQATSAGKVYDGTTVATIAFSGNGLAGDALTFTGNASFVDKNAGLGKTVNVDGIAVGGADAGNYNFISGTTASTMADITPASLNVIVNSDSKFYDGVAYAGNKGSTISGFVNGETIADLSGALNYGGTAQGATGIGNYAITANGLSSANYTVTFVNGALVINPVSQASAALGGSALEQPYNAALQTIGSDTTASDRKNEKGMQLAAMIVQDKDGNRTASQPTPRLSLARCGVLLPLMLGSTGCQ